MCAAIEADGRRACSSTPCERKARALRDLAYTGGKVVLFEPLLNQARVMDAAKYESYLLLGFGASGKELDEKWQIKYWARKWWMASRPISSELVAKDPNVLRLFPKVTICWNTEHAVSLRQIFDEGQGVPRAPAPIRYKNKC